MFVTQWLQWLFQDDNGSLRAFVAPDRQTAYAVAPASSKLLDSRPLYEPTWNLEYEIPRIREPRFSDGVVHEVHYSSAD